MDACARVWKRRKVHSGPAMAGPELERKKGRQLATDRDTEYDDDRTHVVCLPNTWRSKRNGSRDRATREEGKCAVSSGAHRFRRINLLQPCAFVTNKWKDLSPNGGHGQEVSRSTQRVPNYSKSP
ncbi:hypothetical protein PVAP13_2NG021500 [Panicum virgatum]|uniref:Uncharacterized protein n=1 Tax=Panicum virgatum TaxID=38727 RepID=A0A8T0VCY6_PANVG|nr:hypothetical protein PVAP13_2NG021500 [Panicum virgatum]